MEGTLSRQPTCSSPARSNVKEMHLSMKKCSNKNKDGRKDQQPSIFHFLSQVSELMTLPLKLCFYGCVLVLSFPIPN